MAAPREIAWRIFAEEYNSSNCEQGGGGEREPSYIVTPLGARVNRLFVVGVVTDVENIGGEEEPMWRARLSDPTGVFYLSAGRYQPEASAILSKLKPPAFAAVIGKVRTYKPDEGTLYLSIRPEVIKVVDEEIRDYWVLETCRSLWRRLDAMQEVLKMESPAKGELKALGYSESLAEGLLAAREHYRQIPIDRYMSMLGDALRFLLPEYEVAPEMREGVSRKREIGALEEDSGGSKGKHGEDDGKEGMEGESEDERKTALGPPENVQEKAKTQKKQDDETKKEKELEALEEKVLKIIESLDKDSKGAVWDGIFEKAKAEKINKDRLDEALNSLLEKGVIYEPTLGRIRRVVE